MPAATLTSVPRVDRKRYLWLLGIVAMTMPLQGYALYCWSGWSIFWWFSPIYIYLILPVADRLLGQDDANPPAQALAALAADRYYRWVVYLALPFQYLTFVWGTWMAVEGGLAWHQWLGLVFSVGFTSGLGINIAHEMGHQSSKIERRLAKIALAPVAYGHFYVEHNRGHHVRVATPEDPASARFGESFWEFLPRCVIGSVKSAWAIEKRRLAEQGTGPWSWSNDLIQAWTLTLVLYGAMTAWLGWAALPFMLLQAAYGGSLLESVNYLEHYALRRQERPGGGYERCQPEHSWNSNHIATNIFLYHLQRHSDHHAHPTRSYQTLRNFDGLPRLPSGYAALIPISYLPPLWFSIMNPKVVAHYAGDVSRANIKPSIRERVLARYRRAAA
ncbi:MAG: alkane 1-monooxygenase [Gammaproteobacteria bacterium]|nr:alkane 1-monooxygenase [Gammaproteobacteria bacterium]